MSTSKWPFSDPPNVATITVRQIVESGHPILLVIRDPEDDGWQFLTGRDFNVDDGMVVGLREMFDLDSTIADVADLEPGWQASRDEVGAPWRRSHNP